MIDRFRRGSVAVIVLIAAIVLILAGGAWYLYFMRHIPSPAPAAVAGANETTTLPASAGTSTVTSSSSLAQALEATGTIEALSSAVPVETQKILWLGDGLIGLVPTSTTFGDAGGWSTEIKGGDSFDEVVSEVTQNIPPCDANAEDCYGARNNPTIKFTNQILTTDQINGTPAGDRWGNTYSVFKESQDNGGGLSQDFTLIPDPHSADNKLIILAHYARAFCCDASTEDDYKIIVADFTTMTTKVYNLSDLVAALP